MEYLTYLFNIKDLYLLFKEELRFIQLKEQGCDFTTYNNEYVYDWIIEESIERSLDCKVYNHFTNDISKCVYTDLANTTHPDFKYTIGDLFEREFKNIILNLNIQFTRSQVLKVTVLKDTLIIAVPIIRNNNVSRY